MKYKLYKVLAIALGSVMLMSSIAGCSTGGADSKNKDSKAQAVEDSSGSSGAGEAGSTGSAGSASGASGEAGAAGGSVFEPGAAKEYTSDIVLSGREQINHNNNNFSDQAATYLEIMATNFIDKGNKDEFRSYIVNELLGAGYTMDQIEITSIGNIVLTVPGADTASQIIVGGHYDGDGIGDNGSGTALLLATATGLFGQTPAYTTKYIFFDKEEEGLVGSGDYAANMSDEEVKSTLFMINIDSIAFGDYACIYGGETLGDGSVIRTAAYELAMEYASDLGYNIYNTYYLDGYYDSHGTGPALDPNGVFTNPWTAEHPAPSDFGTYSPSTIPASDHVGFSSLGIPYIYFEATNWFAEGKFFYYAYTGYIETYDSSIGDGGMFMNTKYDNYESLEKYFPGRVIEHFNVYSPILSELILKAGTN